MADFYCNHGAYASSLGAAPTWGVPQEGDGSLTTAAAASAIGTIVVNAVAVATNTIGICGLTFTAVASGATVTQFNVGATTQIQADNIAAAFNASTTAVGVSVANGTPQLRNLLFARSLASGAPANTVQIMMRIGSLSLNYATNANVAIVSGGWGTPPTITNFIGGTGGCFGWLLNPAAIGVSSSIALRTYGVLIFKPYVGNPLATDYIWVRTGNNTTVSFSIPSIAHMYALSSPQLMFDTNTKWTGDSAVGKLTMDFSVASGQDTNINTAALSGRWTCLRDGNFEIVNSGLGAIMLNTLSAGSAINILFEGVSLKDTGSGTPIKISGGAWGGFEGIFTYRNLTYSKTIASTTIVPLLAIGSGNSAKGTVTFENCTFNYNLTGGGNPGALISVATAGQSGGFFSLTIKNCSFNGYSAGIDLYQTSASAWANEANATEIIVDSCSGIKIPTAYLGFAANSVSTRSITNKTLNYSDVLGGFRHENQRTVSEYIPASGFPTLSSVMFDGATLWSMRLVWLFGFITAASPGYTAPFRVATRLVSGIRTLKLELYVPNTLTVSNIYSGHVAFTYLDISGVTRSQLLPLSSMVASAASWVANSAASHNAKKIEVVTTYSVMANSEVTAQIVFSLDPPTGARVDIYVDPSIVVT